MSTFTSPLSNILIGSLNAPADPERIRSEFETRGGDPTALDVITEQRGVTRCFGSAAHLGRLGRLAHRLALATDDTVAHLIDTVRSDVARGRTVVVVHGIGRADVDGAARRLRDIGAHDLHYTGRWTSNDHGLIPRTHRAGTTPHGPNTARTVSVPCGTAHPRDGGDCTAWDTTYTR